MKIETEKILHDYIIKFDVSKTQNEFGLIRSMPLISFINMSNVERCIVIVATLGGFVIAFDAVSFKKNSSS